MSDDVEYHDPADAPDTDAPIEEKDQPSAADESPPVAEQEPNEEDGGDDDSNANNGPPENQDESSEGVGSNPNVDETQTSHDQEDNNSSTPLVENNGDGAVDSNPPKIDLEDLTEVRDDQITRSKQKVRVIREGHPANSEEDEAMIDNIKGRFGIGDDPNAKSETRVIREGDPANSEEDVGMIDNIRGRVAGWEGKEDPNDNNKVNDLDDPTVVRDDQTTDSMSNFKVVREGHPANSEQDNAMIDNIKGRFGIGEDPNVQSDTRVVREGDPNNSEQDNAMIDNIKGRFGIGEDPNVKRETRVIREGDPNNSPQDNDKIEELKSRFGLG